MNNNDKNIFDKFLDNYDKLNSKRDKFGYQRVYTKPTKIRCIIGFIFSFIFFILLIRLFVFKILYFVILLVDLIILTYYSLNLFTKKGFPLPTTIRVNSDTTKENMSTDEDIPPIYTEKATKKNEDTYRVDR